MITLLSPSKSQDIAHTPTTRKYTIPEFLDRAAELVDRLRSLTVPNLAALLSVSEKIARLNVDRFAGWTREHTPENALQAIFTYAGDVYRGFAVDSLSAEDLYYAQNHLRTLTGLYGILRPLDLIQPYRLEMATPLETRRGSDLYEFWGDALTRTITEALTNHHDHTVVNLASKEYASAVDSNALDGPVVTPVFKDRKGEKLRSVAIYMKQARGAMARFMIANRVEEPDGLKAFSEDGYRYSEQHSTERELVFVR